MSTMREFDDPDLYAEDVAARRQRARLNHWCEECHGHTGPGSPCAIDEEPGPEDDSPFCECNAEPTINELEDGRCDACGKELQ